MTECLIIGSGIVGLVTAYELRKSGCKITVIENQRSGQASKSAAGILFPINPWENKKNMQDLCIAGHKEYNLFFNYFSKKEQDKIGFEKKDLLLFGKKIDLAKKWYEDRKDIKSEFNNKNVNTIERNIKEYHNDFLKISDVNVINPEKFIIFLKNLLLKDGVRFSREKIEKLDLFLKNKKSSSYDYIIISAGAWSKNILDKENIKLKPIKGQLLHIKSKKKLIENILIYENYYILQKKNNEVIIGSTLEDVGFEEGVTKSAKDYLIKPLSDIFLDKFDILSLKQTYGFRPYSNQEEPYVCLDSNNSRVIYNFGHYRYGILAALPSAKIVNKLIN
tara:strand:+ start:271 stop:1272 length:1002 start_codon:yes stop_codon:yes gene_type:complete